MAPSLAEYQGSQRSFAESPAILTRTKKRPLALPFIMPPRALISSPPLHTFTQIHSPASPTMKFSSKLKRSRTSPPSSSPASPGGASGDTYAFPNNPSPVSPSRKLFSLSGCRCSRKVDSPPPELSQTPSYSDSHTFSPSRPHTLDKTKSSPTAADHPSTSFPRRSNSHDGLVKGSSTPLDPPSTSKAVRAGKGDIVESSMNEIRQVFAQFDTNGDGKISSEELRALLARLGDETTSEEAALMVREVDVEGKGYLNLEEFVQLSERCLHGPAEEEEMKAVFEIFDIDKNGCISAEELQAVLLRLGGGLAQRTTVEECRRMIRGVDQKGSGHVDFADFMRMMTAVTF